MRRRTYLAGLATGIAGLAGCTETEPADDDANELNDGGQNQNTPSPSPSPEATLAVKIIYSGEWQGSLSVTRSGSSNSKSIQGSGTETYQIDPDASIVAVNAQKQDDSREKITVQIIKNGEVVAKASSTAEYGLAQTSKSFY